MNMNKKDWRKGVSKWVKKHADELRDVKTCSNNMLADALYHCKSDENIFAKEILTRAGLLQKFKTTETKIARSRVIDDAAKKLDIIVF